MMSDSDPCNECSWPDNCACFPSGHLTQEEVDSILCKYIELATHLREMLPDNIRID